MAPTLTPNTTSDGHPSPSSPRPPFRAQLLRMPKPVNPLGRPGDGSTDVPGNRLSETSEYPTLGAIPTDSFSVTSEPLTITNLRYRKNEDVSSRVPNAVMRFR